nr:hypothetical protein fc13 [uncultured bacterium]
MLSFCCLLRTPITPRPPLRRWRARGHHMLREPPPEPAHDRQPDHTEQRGARDGHGLHVHGALEAVVIGVDQIIRVRRPLDRQHRTEPDAVNAERINGIPVHVQVVGNDRQRERVEIRAAGRQWIVGRAGIVVPVSNIIPYDELVTVPWLRPGVIDDLPRPSVGRGGAGQGAGCLRDDFAPVGRVDPVGQPHIEIVDLNVRELVGVALRTRGRVGSPAVGRMPTVTRIRGLGVGVYVKTRVILVDPNIVVCAVVADPVIGVERERHILVCRRRQAHHEADDARDCDCSHHSPFSFDRVDYGPIRARLCHAPQRLDPPQTSCACQKGSVGGPRGAVTVRKDCALPRGAAPRSTRQKKGRSPAGCSKQHTGAALKSNSNGTARPTWAGPPA